MSKGACMLSACLLSMCPIPGADAKRPVCAPAETGLAWGDAEVPETVDLDLLQQGQPLSERRIAQLEAFLRTLTDRRYEPLLGR